MKTTMVTTKAVARELMDIVHAVLVSAVLTLIELLMLLVMFPQTTV